MNTITTYASVGTATGKSAIVGQPLGFYFPSTDERMVTSPEAAHEVLGPYMHGADREMCLMALLDTKHRLIGTKVVSLGSVDHTFMSPRDIFRDALLGNASAIVLAHNHPSGSTEPSQDDIAVTQRIVRAGEHIGIDVLDHLVVSNQHFTSLARRGDC